MNARQSSVPDREFDRPQTIDDLRDLAFLAGRIMFAAWGYLVKSSAKPEACELAGQLHHDVTASHNWICDGKWIG